MYIPNNQSWASYFQKVTSVEWVKISAKSYPLPFILGVIKTERCPSATKVTLKVIC
jgi:hypothetical protein